MPAQVRVYKASTHTHGPAIQISCTAPHGLNGSIRVFTAIPVHACTVRVHAMVLLYGTHGSTRPASTGHGSCTVTRPSTAPCYMPIHTRLCTGTGHASACHGVIESAQVIKHHRCPHGTHASDPARVYRTVHSHAYRSAYSHTHTHHLSTAPWVLHPHTFTGRLHIPMPHGTGPAMLCLVCASLHGLAGAWVSGGLHGTGQCPYTAIHMHTPVQTATHMHTRVHKAIQMPIRVRVHEYMVLPVRARVLHKRTMPTRSHDHPHSHTGPCLRVLHNALLGCVCVCLPAIGVQTGL